MSDKNKPKSRRAVLKGTGIAGTALFGTNAAGMVGAHEGATGQSTTAQSQTDIEYPDCSEFSRFSCDNVPEKSWTYRDWEWRDHFRQNIKIGVSHNVSWYFAAMFNGKWEHVFSLSTLFGAWDTRDTWLRDPSPSPKFTAFDYEASVGNSDTMEADPKLGGNEQGVFPVTDGLMDLAKLFEIPIDFAAGLINPVLGGMMKIDDIMQAAETVTEGFQTGGNSFGFVHRTPDGPFGEETYWSKCGGFNKFRFRIPPEGFESGYDDLFVSGTGSFPETSGATRIIGSLARIDTWEDNAYFDTQSETMDISISEVKDVHSFSKSEQEQLGITHRNELNFEPTVGEGHTPEYVALDMPVGTSFETISRRQRP